MDNSTSSSPTPGNLDDNNDDREVADIDQNVGEIAQQEDDDANIPNPFEMVDTVNLLVKYFDGKSLKSSLMVSKLWNTEGMKIFFSNNYIKIPKKLSFGSEIKMVGKLKASFSSSSQFPNAIIKNPRDIAVLQKHNILAGLKHVKVDFQHSFPGELEIQRVESVLAKCPNLNFLECRVSYRFAVEYHSRVIKKCVETGKNGSLTISDLTVNLESNVESFQTFEAFVNSGVKIINLELVMDPDRNEDVKIKIPGLIQKILNCSKDCLQTLSLNSKGTEHRVFSLVKNVPVMEKLEFLEISVRPHPGIEELPVVFPSGFRFNSNCPNLKRFELLLDTHGQIDYDKNYLEKVFASTGPAASVKHLAVTSLAQFQLDHFCQTFSEIEDLKLKTMAVFSDLKPVWKFCRHLKSLWFTSNPFAKSSYIKLLTHLTGHSDDDITRIWNSSNVKISPSYRQSSLLVLQDLENLIFSWYATKDEKSKFLSLLRDFAVPHMPKLKAIEIV